jgi:hypothetical protein
MGIGNEKAIAAYRAMGFAKQKDFGSFLKKPKVSIGMEYRVEKSNYLQKVAEGW